MTKVAGHVFVTELLLFSHPVRDMFDPMVSISRAKGRDLRPKFPPGFRRVFGFHDVPPLNWAILNWNFPLMIPVGKKRRIR